MPTDCYSLGAINNHPFPLDNRPKKYYLCPTTASRRVLYCKRQLVK